MLVVRCYVLGVSVSGVRASRGFAGLRWASRGFAGRRRASQGFAELRGTLSVMMWGSRVTAENRDFHENIDGRKVMSWDVRWTPRALLWPQKPSRNIPGWFLSDFGTSENFRKISISTPNSDTKVLPYMAFANGF